MDAKTKDDSSSTTSDSSDDESDETPVELLVAGRERRTTAGNLYNVNMVVEDVGDDDDDPDELALLFADNQDEVDDEFRSDAEDDDHMSSSDDDDQGPNAGGDELDGEAELDKQRKDERAKKRKAEMALTSKSAMRKKPKIDPTTTRQPLPKKPSKKKERESWIPNEDATGRTSQRKQTIAHRETTLAKLKESEALSKKLRAQKEKRDKERAKDAPKAMTQADRLAEAARIERRNAKSLNRWEAMEKRRSDEQAAKLAALKERKLDGPVVTSWSAKAKWRGPRVSHSKEGTSPVDNPAEPKKRGRKPKAYHEQMAAARGESIPVTTGSPIQQSPSEHHASAERHGSTHPTQTPHVTFAEPQTASNFFLSGIHDFANMQPDLTSINSTNVATPDSGVGSSSNQAPQHPMTGGTNAGTAPVSQVGTALPVYGPYLQVSPDSSSIPAPNEQTTAALVQSQVMAPPALSLQTPSHDLTPAVEMVEEYTMKNLVILDKFDELSEDARHDYGLFFNSKKMPKLVQHRAESCPITKQLARYKDPKTGSGFANLQAYQTLQEVREHKFAWSSMLGCYVGREGGAVARGAPEGFA